jgi:hypothetical protein
MSGLILAFAKVRPKTHALEHIHESWSGKLVTWQDHENGEPTQFTAIDDDHSRSVENLAGLRARKFDVEEAVKEKKMNLECLA